MKIVCNGCGGRLWLSDMQLSGGGCNVVCPHCSTSHYVDASMMDPQAQVPRWYYAVNDESVGPLSTQDIEFNFQNGQLTLDTYVWCEGLSDWMALGAVSEFDYLRMPVTGAPTGSEESTRIADGVIPSYAAAGGGEETAAIDLDQLGRDGGGFSPFDSNNAAGGIMGMDGQAAREEEPSFDMSAQPAPSTPANDLIGARSENSVLFSLSALQAVSAPAASSSAPASSGGAGGGFIDVKALAAGSPAPRRRTSTAAPAGASYAPMNTVMPLGTKKSNTIYIVCGAVIAVLLAAVVLLLVLSGGSDKDNQGMQQANVGSEAVLAANSKDLIGAPKHDPKAQEGNGMAAAAGGEKADKPDEAQKPGSADEKADDGEKAGNADEKADNADAKADDGEKAEEAAKPAEAKKEETQKTETKKAETKTAAAAAAPAAVKKTETKTAAATAKKTDTKAAAAKKADAKTETKTAGGDKLTKDEVFGVIRASFAQVRTCSRTSAKKGKMNVQFVIKANGRVNGAKVTSPEYQGTPTAACVLKVVNGMKFRESGSDTPITYPFQIQ